jgi:hypothetical protein
MTLGFAASSEDSLIVAILVATVVGCNTFQTSVNDAQASRITCLAPRNLLVVSVCTSSFQSLSRTTQSQHKHVTTTPGHSEAPTALGQCGPPAIHRLTRPQATMPSGYEPQGTLVLRGALFPLASLSFAAVSLHSL